MPGTTYSSPGHSSTPRFTWLSLKLAVRIFVLAIQRAHLIFGTGHLSSKRCSIFITGLPARIACITINTPKEEDGRTRRI
jgi:hypothetical protein